MEFGGVHDTPSAAYLDQHFCDKERVVIGGPEVGDIALVRAIVADIVV